MNNNNLPSEQAIEASIFKETTPLKNTSRPRPEDLADLVDLSVEHTPVLLHGRIHPCQCSKLAGGNYAIFNAGYPWATIGNDWWNVPESELKIHRARFLMQRDTFYQDLIIRQRDNEARQTNPDTEAQFRYFRYYTGARIAQPPTYVINKEIVPLYFPNGIWVPSASNPESEKVSRTYQYTDGTIEATMSF